MKKLLQKLESMIEFKLIEVNQTKGVFAGDNTLMYDTSISHDSSGVYDYSVSFDYSQYYD
jgi:hypothetical protein